MFRFAGTYRYASVTRFASFFTPYFTTLMLPPPEPPQLDQRKSTGDPPYLPLTGVN